MLELEGVSVHYGPIRALDAVTLSVARGERLTVLGPSGSGKSTLLRAISGLEPLAAGRISWDGRGLGGVAPHARGFGLMFQDYVLFPHHDVAGNVGFGLRMRGAAPERIRQRVSEVLALVGLPGFERRRVTELSGGEQQRVALARALTPEPQLLMLDEPLGALDRTLRRRLLAELATLFAELALTMLYVTHDQEEALALGDRVAVMHDGRLEAVLPPQELWRSPPSEFVARFLGFNNVAWAEIDEHGRASTPWGMFALSPGQLRAGRGRVLIRPDGLSPDPRGRVSGTVAAVTFRGDHFIVQLAVEDAQPGAPPLEVRAAWPEPPRLGQQLRLALVPGGLVTLPPTEAVGTPRG